MSDASPEFTIRSPLAIQEIGSVRETLAAHFKPISNNDSKTQLHESDDATTVESLGAGNFIQPSRPTEGQDLMAVAGIPDGISNLALRIDKKDYSSTGYRGEEFDITIIDDAGHMMSQHKEVCYFDGDDDGARTTKNSETIRQLRISNLEEMHAFIGSALHLIGLERS